MGIAVRALGIKRQLAVHARPFVYLPVV